MELVSQIIVADVIIHQGGGIGGDIIQRAGHFAAHIIGHLVRGADALDDHQVEDVQRDRDIPAEDFGELPVVFIERGALAAFDVEHTDHLIVQSQRYGQAALGLIEAQHIARVAFDIRADVRSTRGGHKTADAVAFGLGKKVDILRFQRQADTDDQFQFVDFAIQQADREVIKVHQITRVFDDFVFEQFEALLDIQFAEGVTFKANQFAAGFVDGINLLLQTAGPGGIPDHGDHLHHLPGRGDDR